MEPDEMLDDIECNLLHAHDPECSERDHRQQAADDMVDDLSVYLDDMGLVPDWSSRPAATQYFNYRIAHPRGTPAVEHGPSPLVAAVVAVVKLGRLFKLFKG